LTRENALKELKRQKDQGGQIKIVGDDGREGQQIEAGEVVE